MTRQRMLKLVVGDRLVWKLDRARTYTVLRGPEVSKNHSVRIVIQPEQKPALGEGVSILSSAWNRGGVLHIDQFEIDKDVTVEKAQHLVDYHRTDAADVTWDWNGADWCCGSCGMVIDGEGNGTQTGRL